MNEAFILTFVTAQAVSLAEWLYAALSLLTCAIYLYCCCARNLKCIQISEGTSKPTFQYDFQQITRNKRSNEGDDDDQRFAAEAVGAMTTERLVAAEMCLNAMTSHVSLLTSSPRVVSPPIAGMMTAIGGEMQREHMRMDAVEECVSILGKQV